MPKVSELEKVYMAKHAKSRALYERALACFPSGVTHDGRYERPFPIYSMRASGTRKWDVDGNEYVDYVMGHGALLLGYGDERIEKALRNLALGSVHIGACTELEIDWAELIKKLVPCAQDGLVRAQACGTEAIQMAIRLSRAFTNREKIVLHAGSYHGKGDNTILVNRGPPYGLLNVRGIPEGIRKDVVTIPYNDLAKAEETFKTGKTACIVLQGNALYTRDYIKGLEELTTKYGVIFIIDEVVSGFRYAAGGAQEYYDVTPDLAVLGKIVGGGAPIGAVCGRSEILDLYSFKKRHWNDYVRVGVGGTWNAQPICIAGGIAMMKIIESEQGILYPRLYEIGRRIAKSFNDYAEDLGVAALATGLPHDNPTTIRFNFFNRLVTADKFYLWQTGTSDFEEHDLRASFYAAQPTLYANYLSMANNGIYCYHGNFFVTCTKYSEEDLQKTERALEISLAMLKENNLVGC